MIFIPLLTGKESAAQSNPLKIKFGFYDPAVDADNNTEIRESMRLWIDLIKKRSKNKRITSAVVETKYYSDKNELHADILTRSLDIMSLTTWDYFQLHLSDKIIPSVTSSINPESKFERFYLVAHKDSGLDNISELARSEILVPKSTSSYLIKAWLKVRLSDRLSRAKLNTVLVTESNLSESQSLLKIFFNKAGLAVIREGAYFTACELNPQIKKSTSVIDVSPNYINHFLGEKRDLDPEIHKNILLESVRLPSTEEGKQILNIMKTEKVFEINIGDLNATEELFNRYKKLSN